MNIEQEGFTLGERFLIGISSICVYDGIEKAVKMVAGLSIEPTNLSRLLGGTHLPDILINFALAGVVIYASIPEAKIRRAFLWH